MGVKRSLPAKAGDGTLRAGGQTVDSKKSKS